MRVLFVMHYPGYLRYYDSTIHELARRGHRVTLLFDKLSKQREGLQAVNGPGDLIRVAGQAGGRRDAWEGIATDLRRTTDYVRYLHPRFHDAHYLRRRMDATLAGPFTLLRRLPTQPARRVERALRALLRLEHVLPSSARLEKVVRKTKPDVVVVTPLVTDASRQTDLVKAAHALQIPVVLAVASWDHLTTKGMIRERVERVLVWNETQRREAEQLHFVDPARIDVTGAQPFDKWFGRAPTSPRAEFCRRAGLPDDRPYVLFVGSTASISDPAAELQFVTQWVHALRAGPHAALREISVLVRPHPFNVGLWAGAGTDGLGAFSIHPRGGANPVDEDDQATYFDSLHHSAAVVGINTSAMIEAAIVGRPVLTITSPSTSATQSGTLHFGYLTPQQGGCVRVAPSLDEHLDQLAEALEHRERTAAETRAFVGRFIRPGGLERPATPLVADAIERAARERLDVHLPTRADRYLRVLLFALGAVSIYSRPRRLREALRTVRARRLTASAR